LTTAIVFDARYYLLNAVIGEKAMSTKPEKSSRNALSPNAPELEGRFSELIAAMNAGDEQAAKELHEYCRAVPTLWDRLGGLEYNVLESWKRLLAPGDTNSAAFTRDHINTELARRRKALRADGDSQLESLLINRILSAWLQTMHADAAYAQMLQRGGSITEAEYCQKRVDRAQGQLLRSIQALAKVRRLSGPVQVNVGENQINVASSAVNRSTIAS
jgi:hypothetical protein